MRTTLDLDSSVLAQLKQRVRRENKTLGQVASQLLAKALADTEDHTEPGSLVWTAQPMGARVDLDDRDALHRIMDADR
ncbi:MAG TPA: hypothetical protein VF003_13020 [Pseudonocardiaceae bacterium]